MISPDVTNSSHYYQLKEVSPFSNFPFRSINCSIYIAKDLPYIYNVTKTLETTLPNDNARFTIALVSLKIAQSHNPTRCSAENQWFFWQ